MHRPVVRSLFLLRRSLLPFTATGDRLLSSLNSHRPLDLNPHLIASSFEHWFQCPPSDLDLIFRALSSPSHPSSLNSLRLRLDERLVLRVLRHHPRLPPSSPSPLLLKLQFFDWASRHPLYRPSPAAHHAIFLLLIRSRLASVVQDWLRLFSSHRHHSLPHRQETLVVGYAVAGCPDAALQTLARMRFLGLDLGAFGYHVLLNALVEERRFDVADSIVRQITERGLGNSVTVLIHIKSLCKQRRINEARQVLLAAVCKGKTDAGALDRAVACITDELFRERKFKEAEELLEAHGGSLSESAWVRNLVRTHRSDQAMEFLQRRRSKGYVPETNNYNGLLYLLLREGRLKEVLDLLMEIKDCGIVPGQATMNAVLCFFCKGGMTDVAMKLYNSRHELCLTPNNMAFYHLIHALCVDGNLEEACLVLEQSMSQGYFPRKKTFHLLTSVLRSRGKLDKMGAMEERYLVAMERATALRIPLSRGAYVGLIRGFIALRRGDMMCSMLMEMQDNGYVPSQKLYRDCICGLCEVGRLDLVFSLLHMQLSRKEIDQKKCYNFFIDGLGHAQLPEVARKVYEMMQEANLEPDISSKILMLQSYMKSKRVGEALRFFDEIHAGKEPSNRMQNILIVGLCRAARPESAMVIWEEVRKKGVVPSLHCYEELIKLLCWINDYPATVKVIEDFQNTGRPLSPFICNHVLMHSLKSESLGDAWFKSKDGKIDNELQVPQKDGIVPVQTLLGNLVAVFSGGIKLAQHIDILDDVLEKHIPVNMCTYNTLLRGMAKAGRMDDALKLFDKMCKKGYTPNEWTYDIIIRGLYDIGKKKDALTWMAKMHQIDFSPTIHTFELLHRKPEGLYS